MDALCAAQEAAEVPSRVHEHHARTRAADCSRGGFQEWRHVSKTCAALVGFLAWSAIGQIEKGWVRNHQICCLMQRARETARQVLAPELRVHLGPVCVFAG